MAGYEHKDNSGSLFRNDRKEKENQPDYKGSCMVNGAKMEMAAWIKEKADGSKFMSFKFSEPMAKTAKQPVAAEPPSEDIPF